MTLSSASGTLTSTNSFFAFSLKIAATSICNVFLVFCIFRRAAENTKQRKHRRRKNTTSKKELSHRDAF